MSEALRISEDAENYRALFLELRELAEDVKQRRVSTEQGDVMAKARFAAMKLLEGDLHARMFSRKIDSVQPKALPKE